MSLVDIASQLEEPFPLEDIELLPKGSIERDGKTVCMAMPYADVRVYQDRLNKLACGEWSTPPPLALVVGTKLITYVTIVVYGVPHTDVGEAGPGENQGTEAFAQAFKRACSQFGLGRYLYSLDKAWVPYNPKGKRIDLDANGIKNVVRQMYQKAGITLKGVPPVQQPATNGTQREPQALRPVPAAQPAPSVDPANVPAVARLRARCTAINKNFDAVVKAICKEARADSDLTVEDCAKLANLLTQWEAHAEANKAS